MIAINCLGAELGTEAGVTERKLSVMVFSDPDFVVCLKFFRSFEVFFAGSLTTEEACEMATSIRSLAGFPEVVAVNSFVTVFIP